MAAQRWIMYTLDISLGIFICLAAISCLVLKGKVEAQLLAVSLQIITDALNMFSHAIRCKVDVDNFMTCFQRMYEYTQLE